MTLLFKVLTEDGKQTVPVLDGWAISESGIVTLAVES